MNMLLLELLYILVHANSVLSEGAVDISAAAYRFDCREGSAFYLKTLIETYAEKFNYSVAFDIFEEIPHEKLANYDFALVEANDYRFLDPNPFVLTAVVPFISLILMIPSTVKADKFLYFAIPFEPKVWAALMVSPFCFATLLRIINRKSSYTDHIQRSFRIMLSQPPKLRTTNYVMKTVYALMLCFSSIISTIYSCSLGSFLIKTIDEFDFEYMCPESRIILGENPVRYKIVGFSEYLDHIIAMDMSYAYCIASNMWGEKNVHTRQKYYFKIIPPWKSTDGHSLRVNKNFTHLDEFNMFLVNAFSFGLLEKWNSELTTSRSSTRINEDIEHYDQILRQKDFLFPQILFSIGMAAGIVAFCVEVIAKKFKEVVFKRRFCF